MKSCAAFMNDTALLSMLWLSQAHWWDTSSLALTSASFKCLSITCFSISIFYELSTSHLSLILVFSPSMFNAGCLFSLLFVVLSFCSLLFQSSFSCHEPHLYFCSLSFPYFRKDLSMFAAAYKKRLWQLPCISHSVMFKTKGALNYFILFYYFIFPIVAPVFGQKVKRTM